MMEERGGDVLTKLMSNADVEKSKLATFLKGVW